MALTLIVEPNPGGHRFQAVANVAQLAGRTGGVILLTSGGAAASDAYAVHLAGVGLAVDERLSRTAPPTRELAGAIAAVCRSQPVATVVVMDGDAALKTWWLIAAKQLRGLRPRPRVIFFLTRYPARLEFGDAADLGYWRLRLVKGALLILARATRTIDRAAGFAGRDEPARGWLVKRARDPATCDAHSRDRAQLRAELGLPADRRLVGIFGGINVRKSPQLVFDAVLATGPDTDLVLAGPVNDEIRAWLDGLDEPRRRRVLVEDGFLPNERLDRYLAASDVVALVMTLEGPSGIQGKAIAADVPIVTAGSKTRERELAAIGRGVATRMTVEGVADGLRRVLAGDAPAATPAAGRLELPTGETFAATVLGVSGSGRAPT